MAYKRKTKDCYVKNIQRKCELSCTNQKMERKKRKRGKLKWQNLKI